MIEIILRLICHTIVLSCVLQVYRSLYLEDGKQVECERLETRRVNESLYQKYPQRMLHEQLYVCVKVMGYWSSKQ